MRQYTSFIWFERAEPRLHARRPGVRLRPRRGQGRRRPRPRSGGWPRSTWPRPARIGASDVALEAIEDHFTDHRRDHPPRRAGPPRPPSRATSRPSSSSPSGPTAGRCRRRSATTSPAFYRSLREQDGLSHEDAVRDTVVSVLMSPHFCYRVDLRRRGAAGDVRPLSDYALASRLSYFLWSSMPDEELLAHAAAGDLHEPDVLAAQARRMLPRRPRPRPGHRVRRQLARLPPLRGAQQRRPRAVPDLQRRAAAGDVRGADPLLRRPRPQRPLGARLPRRQAHVRQPGPGPPLRHARAAARGRTTGSGSTTRPRYGRGGLLPMAVFLTKNSPGLRTSPVKRGYWVVRRLLGENIPRAAAERPRAAQRRGEARRPDPARDPGPAPRRQALRRLPRAVRRRSAWPSRATAPSARRATATSAAARSTPARPSPAAARGPGSTACARYLRDAPAGRLRRQPLPQAAGLRPRPQPASPRTTRRIDAMRAQAGGRRRPLRRPGRDDRHQPAVPEQARRRPTRRSDRDDRDASSSGQTRPRPRGADPADLPPRRRRDDGPAVARVAPRLGRRAGGDGARRRPKRFAALFMGCGVNPDHWWAKGSGADDGAGPVPRAAGAAEGQDQRRQRPVQQARHGRRHPPRPDRQHPLGRGACRRGPS